MINYKDLKYFNGHQRTGLSAENQFFIDTFLLFFLNNCKFIQPD